MKRVFVFVAN